MKKSCVIVPVLVALCFCVPGTSLARSCLPPALDEASISNAAVIFEGIAGDHRALSRAKAKALESAGIGIHIKIQLGDRACQSDGECTFIQTHCGACSCGTPIARVALAKYEALLEEACTAKRRENCEIHCEAPVPYCRQGICVLQ